MNDILTILQGDCREVLKALPSESVQCCVTSPPYWGLRDYGHAEQIGLEETPEAYVETMRQVFSEVWRVLRDDGTLFLNLGDSYYSSPSGQNGTTGTLDGGVPCGGAGTGTGRIRRPPHPTLKPKDLVGIPWRVAFALQADGWWLRQDIIWAKSNPMPESVTDRCTKSHEYLFLLSKRERYYFNAEAIAEPCETPMDSKARCGFGSKDGKCDTMEYSHSNETGKRWNKTETRNKRSVWTVTTKPCADAHFATFPPDLIKPCILAGCPLGETVLDPFSGSGTTGMVALELGRKAILIELNPEYVELAQGRCNVTPGLAM